MFNAWQERHGRCKQKRQTCGVKTSTSNRETCSSREQTLTGACNDWFYHETDSRPFGLKCTLQGFGCSLWRARILPILLMLRECSFSNVSTSIRPDKERLVSPFRDTVIRHQWLHLGSGAITTAVSHRGRQSVSHCYYCTPRGLSSPDVSPGLRPIP